MALSRQDYRLAFYCEKRDDISHLVRRYVLLFFNEDSSVEMRELPKNVLHLKRTQFTHLTKDNFSIGASLTILGQIVKLTGYADEVTRVLCEKSNETTTVVLGEALFPQTGRCLAVLTEECGFNIFSMQMAWVDADTVVKYGLPEAFVSTSRVIVACCIRADAIQKGLDYTRRIPGACAASSDEEARKWSQLAKDAKQSPVVLFGHYNSSMVIVKPHAVRSRAAGSVLQQLIDCGLELTALALIDLSASMVDKFLEPYKGVFPNYSAVADALSGTVWVAQFLSIDDGVDVISTVREACGPFDPCIAKKLRPSCIRARFGVDRSHNAVHCCDLPGDGPIYAEFFFAVRDLEE